MRSAGIIGTRYADLSMRAPLANRVVAPPSVDLLERTAGHPAPLMDVMRVLAYVLALPDITAVLWVQDVRRSRMSLLTLYSTLK